MNVNVPYLMKLGNLPKILDRIQRAGAPETFNIEFLKDLGFTSSQDRPVVKLFKYVGLLDLNGHPTSAYREFMDQNRAKVVLAARLTSGLRRSLHRRSRRPNKVSGAPEGVVQD